MNFAHTKCLKKYLSFLILFGLIDGAYAAGFQLLEQDAASIGEFHAGYAALGRDASTGFYNPAGLTFIKNKQVVFGGLEAISDVKYTGNISVTGIDGGTPQPVVAQGGVSAFVPFFHYAQPLCDKYYFSFNIDVPFGSKVSYGRSTLIQYATVRANLQTVDISPAIGYQANDKLSLGAGLDFQPMMAQFVQMGINGSDTANSTNKMNDIGYGVHFGGIYQYSSTGRVGLSYHSQVFHHVTGYSLLRGPLADSWNDGKSIRSNGASMNITLPAYTALSVVENVNPQLTVMGSAIFTQWSVVNTLILKNVAGLVDTVPSQNVNVIDPQHFRNTWTLSVGADYNVSEKMILRGGLGYDQTPTNNSYRNVLLPDNNRYIVALGGHYQSTKTIGIDLSWMHVFMSNAAIHPPAQVAGDNVVTTTSVNKKGSGNPGGDVYAAQITWNIL